MKLFYAGSEVILACAFILGGAVGKAYSFSRNHGSGKWLCLKGSYYWRGPFFTAMIMGARVYSYLIKYILNIYTYIHIYIYI